MTSVEQRVRPSTVTVATWLLYLTAAMNLINGISAVAIWKDTKRGYAAAYAGTTMANQVNTIWVNILGGAVVAVILGALMVVLALLVDRGNRIGRILVWIFGGLYLCCGGFGLISGAFVKGIYDSSRSANPSMPSYQRIEHAVSAAEPGWYTPVTTVAGILGLVAIVLAIILLVLPSSHPYFRTVQPVWEPPAEHEPHEPTYAPPEHEEDTPAGTSGDHLDPPPAAL